MAGYRVLSLDGGGIRGLLTIMILQRLERALPGWLGKVDLIAGVSSGGIIALLLANGVAVDRIRRLVEESSSTVFTRDWLQSLYGLGGTIGPRYRNTPLLDLLRKELGNNKLADLKKHVLIPAFDLDNGSRRARRRRRKAC
ncbi:MAG: patatin-like phospholipase family protein [Myxococcota bacterium]